MDTDILLGIVSVVQIGSHEYELLKANMKSILHTSKFNNKILIGLHHDLQLASFLHDDFLVLL